MGTKIGGFLLWFPIMLIFSGIFIICATEMAFDLEARDRGFDDVNSPHRIDSNGCFVKNQTGVISKFCKSDYGFLGLKTWMDAKDKSTYYGLFDKTNTDVPKDICNGGRVIDYSLVKANDSVTVNVKCNN